MTKVGRIFRAVPMDPGEPSALVLVTDFEEATQSFTVTLLSPDMELGGSADLVIAPEDSGLPYSLVAESDIFGYLWVVQLDRELGSVAEHFLEALVSLRNDDPVGLAVAGPPVAQKSDPRWGFKLNELARLQRLSAHCTRELVDGERVASIDPEALRAPRTDSEVAVFEEFVLEVIEGVRRGDTIIPGWLVNLALNDKVVAAYRAVGCFPLLRMLWDLADQSEAPIDTEAKDQPGLPECMNTQIEVWAAEGRSNQWLVTRTTDVVRPVEVRGAYTSNGRLVQLSYVADWSALESENEVFA